MAGGKPGVASLKHEALRPTSATTNGFDPDFLDHISGRVGHRHARKHVRNDLTVVTNRRVAIRLLAGVGVAQTMSYVVALIVYMLVQFAVKGLLRLFVQEKTTI